MYGTIYKITNVINGKIYIGKTVKLLTKRLSEHISKAINEHSDTYLHNTIRKYGKNNFIIEEIEKCDSEEELSSREIFWIKELKSMDRVIGYNLTIGGDGCSGYKHTAEAIEANRKSHIGSKHSEKTKKSMSLSHRGKINMATAGKKHINNGKISKMVDEKEVNSYLNNGWILGRSCNTGQRNKGKLYIHKNGALKFVLKRELKTYILNGWEVGNPKISKSNKTRKSSTAGKIRVNKDGKIKYILKEEKDLYEKSGWKTSKGVTKNDVPN